MQEEKSLILKVIELQEKKGYGDGSIYDCKSYLRNGSAILDCIVLFQSHYFYSGDRKNLIPMVYKDIAFLLDKDISTIARVVEDRSFRINNKTVYYKSLFQDGVLKNKQGREICQAEFIEAIIDIIINEDKKKPYTDDLIVSFLQDRGYDIARRTVAKYRNDFLGIPSSHHRC